MEKKYVKVARLVAVCIFLLTGCTDHHRAGAFIEAEGVVVDAWFAGFAESTEGNLYFVCIWEEPTVRMSPAPWQWKWPFSLCRIMLPANNRSDEEA